MPWQQVPGHQQPTLSSLVALEVVIMTTSGTASVNKVGIIMTLSFQWWYFVYLFIFIFMTPSFIQGEAKQKGHNLTTEFIIDIYY